MPRALTFTLITFSLLCIPFAIAQDEPAVEQVRDLRLVATIYQVMLSNDQVMELDAWALTKQAQTLKDFHERLSTLGKIKVWSHVDQSIALGQSTEIHEESRLPVINSIANPKADIVTVNFREVKVGVQYLITAMQDDDGVIVLDLSGTIRGSRAFKIPVQDASPQFDITAFRVACHRSIDLASPLILIATAGDHRGSGEVCAYVARVYLTDPS